MLAIEPAPKLLAEHLTRHSEGNPFFVAEYLRMAVSEGLLHRDEVGTWQVGEKSGERETRESYQGLPLPGSIHALVERRIGGLSAKARALLDAASVLAVRWS